jgi:hypothetical protein
LGKFQVTLDEGICRKCNGDRLGGLEQLVQPSFIPMAVRGGRVMLDLVSQRLFAVWAIKTVELIGVRVFGESFGRRRAGDRDGDRPDQSVSFRFG